MKLSTVQQLTLIAAFAAFLYAPVYAFKAVAPGDDKSDINNGWIVMKYDDFDETNRRHLKIRPEELIEMKIFKKRNMTHTDALELCRRNNAVLVRNGLLKTKTIAENFPFEPVWRGSPWISPEAALPSLSAGALFGLGMASFVVAIDHLNASIAYPICAMAPGLVVSMWSILYFREITGKRNLIVLAVAYCFTLVGVTLMTVSREVVFP
ncbi:hypothetical protein Q1695_010300 [Nippostrongylus brasiliensis]|nr:hypothetical protein Q1695_010300 [Nippostrongylus brasiliensis]